MVAPSHPVLDSSLGSSTDQQVATIQGTNLENWAAGYKMSTGPAQKLIQFFLLRPRGVMSTWAAPCSGVVPSKSGLKKCVFVSNFGCIYIFKLGSCLSFLYFHLQTSAPALTSLSATLRIIKVRFITNVASADSLALVTAAHVVHCRDPSNRPTCYSDDARSHRWRCLSKLLLGNP